MRIPRQIQIQETGKLSAPPLCAASSGGATKSCRLFVTDRNSGRTFLIDSGADISAIPPSQEDIRRSSDIRLYSANGGRINTYGEKLLSLDLGLRREFNWIVRVADIGKPIIGADFLNHFKLDVSIHQKCLIDTVTKLRVNGSVQPAPNTRVRSIDATCEFFDLLQQYPEITRSAENTNQPRIVKHSIQHYIETKGPPRACKARLLPLDKLKTAKSLFDHMLKAGICRPSKSPWASPLLMKKKSDGSWRPCGDYRVLNSVTVPNQYPTAHALDYAAMARDMKIFSKIDLVLAFNQIPVNEPDIPKTAVITQFVLFEFPFMGFGMCGASQTFHQFIHEVFRGLTFVFPYCDDILIASKNKEEHRKHLRTVFERLKGYNLTINIDKCEFGKEELNFIGYRISAKGTTPIPDRVQVLLDYKKPNTIQELRRFLGAINFYRRFIKNAAESQALLNEHFKDAKKNDKRPVIWNPNREAAFQKCKKDLADAALLVHPAANAKLRIVSDASDIAMGAALEQQEEAGWGPLAFFSRKFTKAEKNYSTYDRELTALYEAAIYFRQWIEGNNKVVLCTDHKPLLSAFKQLKDKVSPRVQRQLSVISEFSMNIQ